MVSGSPTDGLEQAALIAQESLAVCIKNGDEADFRNVQPFPKEVDANDDVDVAQAEGIDDLGALNGINFRVEMMRLHAHPVEISGHLFGELDGHDRDQTPFLSLNTSVDFRQQIVDLPGRRPYLDLGIKKTRWPEFHLSDALDALEHVVHGFCFGVFLGQVCLTCTASRRRMQQSVGYGLPRGFTQMTKFAFARRGRDIDHLGHQTLEFRQF